MEVISFFLVEIFRFKVNKSKEFDKANNKPQTHDEIVPLTVMLANKQDFMR